MSAGGDAWCSGWGETAEKRSTAPETRNFTRRRTAAAAAATEVDRHGPGARLGGRGRASACLAPPSAEEALFC